MPLKCPSCSRINADKAKACAYCNGSLENAESFVPSRDVTKLAEHFLKKEPPKKTESEKKEPAPPKPTVVTSRPTAVPPKSAESAPQSPTQARTKPDLKVIPGGRASFP